MACETWLARDFLLRHGRDPGPPCGHDPDLCPPDNPDEPDVLPFQRKAAT